MNQTIKSSCLASTAAALAFLAWPAAASETVIGGGFAKDCEYAATVAADQGTAALAAIDTCDKALVLETLSIHDIAATYANRAILSLVDRKYDIAEADFTSAIKTMPTLGGAHCDMGATLIAEGRFAEGIAEIDHGLALGTAHAEKAYFNRAIAHEHMGNLKAAYYDYTTAANMKPDWQQPKLELARFKVSSLS